mmetsp:Transcript_14978/g.15159  ORF Transcript_14978/g.15159 Transcript_14978/m.15159 type:complete len:82 (-) Transcript_14978:517-762(-)
MKSPKLHAEKSASTVLKALILFLNNLLMQSDVVLVLKSRAGTRVQGATIGLRMGPVYPTKLLMKLSRSVPKSEVDCVLFLS